MKYRIFTDSEGPLYSLEKDRIIRIVYQNGRVETYESNLKNPEYYIGQPTTAIKVNFLSPLLGYTQLNYEKNLRPGRSYELSLGIIGLGKNQEMSTIYFSGSNSYESLKRGARGVFSGAGYKFTRIPDFINKGTRYSHLFQGSYVKPELILGLYGQNFYRNNPNGNPIQERESIFFTGLLINVGKQWVLGDAFLIDIYGGLGYALDTLNRKYDNSSEYTYNDLVGNHFAMISGVDSAFGITGGFKIGLLLNQKK